MGYFTKIGQLNMGLGPENDETTSFHALVDDHFLCQCSHFRACRIFETHQCFIKHTSKQ